MPHPQVMFMLRLLAALSWTDGSLDERESEALERLIKSADLDDDERARARTWLAAPIDYDEADLEQLSENQRLATYQAAVRIALTDQDFADAERVFLDRIRDALGVSAEQALEIEGSMSRGA